MSLDIHGLATRLRGPVIGPDDGSYDTTRRTFNAMLDHRPAVIVQPLDTDDVVAAVQWAAESDLPISIRGGGHSVAGHSVGDGSIMIDLGRMRRVEANREARIATVEGGAKLLDLDTATTAHGLAAPSGTYSDTGVGGLVLGGGISYLLGSRGLACDALVGATLVTADGSVVEVDGEREPELLWALRGGSGNFGVVTELRLALGPIGEVYNARLRFRGADAPALLERYFELEAAAPDELTTQAVLWHAPEDGPGITMIGAWSGDPGEGIAAFAPFVDGFEPIEDLSRRLSYVELQQVFERMGPDYRHYWKGQFVGRTDGAFVDVLGASHEALPAGHGIVLIEPMHGMVHRIPEGSAAFGARRAVANVSALAVWTDPTEDPAHLTWARESVASWAPWSLQGGGYVNYTPADETATRIEQMYGAERFTRLRAVKRRCDPDNRFRFNANIPPAD
jgi:FAD/FMN-containing dehydrogenase